jgi:hypothetical protein
MDIARFVMDHKDLEYAVYEYDYENFHVCYDVAIREMYVTDNENDEEVKHDFEDFYLDGAIEKIEADRQAIIDTEKNLVKQLFLF